jgi:hypothetical protein
VAKSPPIANLKNVSTNAKENETAQRSDGFFIVIVLFFSMVARGQTDQSKPAKPKVHFKGTWYYNGVGMLYNKEHLDSVSWITYNHLPINSDDTITFLDSTTLLINHSKKYNNRLDYKWSIVERNDSKYWETYIIVDGYEYFIHIAITHIEMQYQMDNIRWYGRFEEIDNSRKKKRKVH